MCEQTEISYLDGEVVWVKLGSCWWPGEVVGADKLPPDVLPSFKKPPIAVVKFFQESTYEYVKNINSIYKYNCSRKDEFIKKGLYMYRSKHGHMEKFPEDVIRAETEVGGDPDILTREEFQEAKKESYAGIFGSASKKTPTAGRGRAKPPSTPKTSTPVRRFMREKSDYKVHILLQGSKTPSQATDTLSTPSTSRAGSEPEAADDRTPKADKPSNTISTPTSAAGVYPCPLCSFTTTRLNVLILHNKTHSATFTPYTPSPVRKKPVAKSPPKATPNKTPKARKPRKEKTEKVVKKSQAQKRISNEQPEAVEVKKPKTDEEIKSSLLADWDDGDDLSNDGSPEAASPELPTPAEPTPAELPAPAEPEKTESLPSTEKLETTSDSKYEFCEDEDWSLEADAGRKIPRVKNPAKRKEERKSITIDDDDVAREVAELLNRTTVPELPAAPEPLTVEENFPEPSIVKSPDKKVQSAPESSKPAEKPATEAQPTKAIFKTKTFFRSRHSRSQDAIGKYVAEQLNAAERMNAESELNGSEMISSPEHHRESPPIEHVKVARLAPKIQLKKMKAEAAQQREKEKTSLELTVEDKSAANGANFKVDNFVIDTVVANEKQNDSILLTPPILPPPNLDVLYPTQEIKPINKDTNAKEKCDKLNQPLFDSTCNKDDVVSGQVQKLEEKKEERISNVDEIMQSNSQKSCEQLTAQFMNESTASAVDALLSVSREADRVTKTISDDLPEDLFEDDNKDNGVNNYINNGFCKESKEDNDVENRQKPEGIEPIVEEVPMIESVKENERDNGPEHNSVDDNSIQCDDNISQHNDENIPQHYDNISQQNDENIPQDYNDNISQNNDGEFSQHKNLDKTNEHLVHNDVLVESEVPMTDENNAEIHCETVVDNAPSESDLQIAEALINLPATAIKNKTPSQHQDTLNFSTHFSSEPFQEEIIQTANNVEVNDEEVCETSSEDKKSAIEPNVEAMDTSNTDNINARYETEEEKTENLFAAQSLVEMSECIEHKLKTESKLPEIESPISVKTITEPSNTIDASRSVEQKVASLSSDNNSDATASNVAKFETSSSKLLKILEEPCMPKIVPKTPTKQVIMTGKEKILNFDVSKAAIKSKAQSPKQKIIIRRNTPSKGVMNSLTEIGSPDNIILSRSSKPPDGSSVQTYTITATPEPAADPGTIIIQQKIRKVSKPAPKLQKLKQQFSLVTSVNDSKPVEQTSADDTFYDINSMPIVLSDDILTPENIEKMPIVMSDGKIITNPTNPPKLIKTKGETEKKIVSSPSKPELKTLLMNPAPEVSKVTTPNILSKSAKLRGSKPMLVIDKATGKQKIIMTKAESTVKEIKQAPQTTQHKLEPTATNAAGKFIILPAGGAPQPTRTQKIVIDPQTGKAHVLVSKPEPPDNKPVSAKLLPPPADGAGNTVMIITNAQGAQSRIVLTPEHEKILFPNKQQPKVSQLKTVTQRVVTSAGPKPVATTAGPAKIQNAKIVPKQQKSAIITSKGQLIVGGRVATTAQNIAPMPEIRPRQRVVAAESRKLAQAVQKTSSEPLIFLQQKSGQVMQLTAAQFEHLKRTGQIVQKAAPENKPAQKTIQIPASEGPVVQKKLRRPAVASPTPAKRAKQEVAIAPAPAPALAPAPAPLPALAPLAPAPAPAPIPAPAPAYPELENFEELLPSTAIVRSEPVPAPEPPPAPLSDGQLLAVPGEHFGGPPGSFYLCVEDAGSLTPIDNRPLVLENNQLVPMGEPAPPERRDILEAALANSDVFHEPPRDDPPFRDLNANVSVHCRVSETSSAQQPIMTPVEVPSLGAAETEVPASLEAGLAVIGVTPHVPTTLELPITVTDPRIAPRVADPLGLLPEPELPFVPDDTAVTGAISMPLLMEEEAVGKSMPLLTDDPPPEPVPAWRDAAATS